MCLLCKLFVVLFCKFHRNHKCAVFCVCCVSLLWCLFVFACSNVCLSVFELLTVAVVFCVVCLSVSWLFCSFVWLPASLCVCWFACSLFGLLVLKQLLVRCFVLLFWEVIFCWLIIYLFVCLVGGWVSTRAEKILCLLFGCCLVCARRKEKRNRVLFIASLLLVRCVDAFVPRLLFDLCFVAR